MDKPGKFVLQGMEGLGKTTLAAQFPAPIFIDTEEGTERLDVARLDKPTSVPHLMHMINSLTKDHMGFKTLVIDTIDWLQDIFTASAIAQCPTLKHMGFNKEENAYNVFYTEWGRFRDALTELRNSGMFIVLVAHCKVKQRDVPEEMGAYDRYQLKLYPGASDKTAEWAEFLWFMNMRIYVTKDGQGERAHKKATGGERIIYTNQHPCWSAKSKSCAWPGTCPTRKSVRTSFCRAPRRWCSNTRNFCP
jgi:hypothetical protein